MNCLCIKTFVDKMKEITLTKGEIYTYKRNNKSDYFKYVIYTNGDRYLIDENTFNICFKKYK